MPQVKVWNDNKYEHVETFKNEEIRILPGDFITMDYNDAIDFKGRFTGLKMLGPNNPDPRGFKMIRVDEPTEPIVKEDKNVFHATGKAFESREEMLAFAKAFAEVNANLVSVDPELEAQKKDRADRNRTELLERIAALEALVAKVTKGKAG